MFSRSYRSLATLIPAFEQDFFFYAEGRGVCCGLQVTGVLC